MSATIRLNQGSVRSDHDDRDPLTVVPGRGAALAAGQVVADKLAQESRQQNGPEQG